MRTNQGILRFRQISRCSLFVLLSTLSSSSRIFYYANKSWDSSIPENFTPLSLFCDQHQVVFPGSSAMRTNQGNLLRISTGNSSSYTVGDFGGYIRMLDAQKYEKGPFDILSVGGDMPEAIVMKFSNGGRLMLLTTAGGLIHVVDSFCGALLSTCNVKPVLSNSTLEASFSHEGMFVISDLSKLGAYVGRK